MRNFISTRVQSVPPSGIRRFFDIAATMKNVISLGIGEPDFVTPWHIREAAIFALEKGRTCYTSNLGLPKLRRAVAKWTADRFAVDYDPINEVLITVGASEAIDLALRALINPGDEVLYHEPCYVSYSPSIALAHGVAVAVSTRPEDDFRLTAEALAQKITSKSKALMLNFPTNPTGATQTVEELRKIAALCVKHDLVVITDEIYSELTFDGAEHHSIVSIPGMAERTIFIHGCSKSFAMTGFRIGYACAPAPLIDAMMKVHQYGIMCASIIAQEAAIEALENGASSVKIMRDQYELRRNFMISRFRDMGLPCATPKGSFYLFPRVDHLGVTSSEFSMELLKAHNVAVVPGTAFGASGEGFVRACFATGLDQIKIAMNRMEMFVAGLERQEAAVA
jgi:aminotransferase